MPEHQLHRTEFDAVRQEPACHSSPTAVRTAALDSGIPVQLRNVCLQRVTGYVIDLLASLVIRRLMFME